MALDETLAQLLDGLKEEGLYKQEQSAIPVTLRNPNLAQEFAARLREDGVHVAAFAGWLRV
ncbi:MAG: hypothetical protein GY789_15620 [Hyphomicrobiales bacterium]|nr:hypothetical protein [Hyphomicrobiales bacterium]MCP4999837.1 hypothetical protein [Hyphomicrobiales bacterium]